MQGIYNYIPETNHVSIVYNVAAVTYLQFVLHAMLFYAINMFCTFTLALSVAFVQCPMWLLFFLPLILCFPVMLLRYCLSDSEMVPVAPITGITFAFTFHMRWISITRSLYFKIFSDFSWSLFCLQELQHLLTYMFLVYHGLWCPIYC